MSITIPQEVVTRVTARVRSEYALAFGDEALSGEVRSLTCEQVIQIYARDVLFWRERLPRDPSELRDVEAVALHALCSNAEARLLERARELGVEEEVKARVGG